MNCIICNKNQRKSWSFATTAAAPFFLTSRQKGPILTNEYLFGTEQERKKIDKRASYHLLTGVFGCLGGMFTGAAIFIFTDKNGVCILIAITVGLASIIYAVIQSIRDKKSK